MAHAFEKQFALVSPEAVRLSFPLGSLPARIIAFSIDLFLVFLAATFVVLAGLALSFAFGMTEPLAMGVVGMFVIRHFYFTFFEVVSHGTTPGKRMLGLRVIARDGQSLSVEAVITRNLMRDIELMLPLTLLLRPDLVLGEAPAWVGVPAMGWAIVVGLLPFITDDRTRAGDLVGGTVVVAVPKPRLLLDEADRGRAQHGEARIVFSEKQLSVYGELELEALADLMRKIGEGRADSSDQALIAQTIAEKIGYQGDAPTFSPTRFLQAFYSQQRASLERKLVFGKRKASKNDPL